MSTAKTIEFMTGYKATDRDMKCRGYKFKLGVWHKVEGDIIMCCNGFHFCTSLPGVWQYYDNPSQTGTRVFKCEAQEVLDTEDNNGVLTKKVCRMIRLTEEIKLKKSLKYNRGTDNTGEFNDGYCNTGESNHGVRNSGYQNHGASNTGRRNTGDSNTGDNNKGENNSGSYNTGNNNTGSNSVGYSNSGSHNRGCNNSGQCNYGDRNSGDYNAGNRNSGLGNACDSSSDLFAVETPKVKCFGKQTRYTQAGLIKRYPIITELARQLQFDTDINFEYFRKIPGITPAKLKALHAKYIRENKRLSRRHK